MARFIADQQTVEAVQFLDTADQIARVSDFVDGDISLEYPRAGADPLLRIGDDPRRASLGDWVVRDERGQSRLMPGELFASLFLAQPEPRQ